MKLRLILSAISLTASMISWDLALAQDSTGFTRPVVGYSKPPASTADNVPAAGIQGQVNDAQVQSLDGAKVTGTVGNAQNAVSAQSSQTALQAQTAIQAQSAQTAVTATTSTTAQALDPNMTIDAGRITGLPTCASGEVITIMNGAFGCITVTAAAPAKAQFDTYVGITTVGSYSWTVPAGIYKVKAHLVGGGSGGATPSNGSNSDQVASGADGGYAYKTLTVTPGDVLSGVVGSGGSANGSGGASGAGGESSLSKNGALEFKATGATSASSGYSGGGRYNGTAGTGIGGDFNGTSNGGTAYKPLAAGSHIGQYGKYGAASFGGCSYINDWDRLCNYGSSHGIQGVVWIEF